MAVKSLKGEVTSDAKMKFLQEAVIMGQFSHPNIIKILGVVLQDSVGYNYITVMVTIFNHCILVCFLYLELL